MYNKCCVVSCASRRQDISFHQFPKSEKGLRKWLQCINCKILQSMSFQELRKSFVCRNHFEKRFLALKRDRARLRTGAYPTLFTPSEISSNFPQKSFLDKTEIASMNLAAEHSYPRKRHYDHTYGKQPLLESHRRQNLKTTVEAIPQTSAEQAFNQLENYEVETLDYTLLETSGDDNYEGAADSDSDTNSEASHSALRNQKQFEGLEDREIETTSVDQLNVDGQPLDINTVPEQEPPSWSSVKDVCRACLSKSGAWDLTETYLTEDGENERLLDMLTLCYGIRLSNVSECSASRFLCDVCAASLRHADSFRRQVRRAEGSFADYYGAGDQEIKEECSDEDEGHEKEVSCINKPTESMELDILPSRHISELPSNLKVYHRKRTKPSVEGSTKTAPQNNSMSELSYSDKYIRVISYSANKNVENGSADKEINIESQTAEEFKNVEETNNASHCDEDLLYSDIKRRKNGQDHQNTLSTPKNSKNVPQTPEKDSSHLKQLLERHIPDENAMTFHPLSKTNPKAVKRKNSSATNVTDIDLNFTSIVTQPENNVQQSDGSDSIDFSQSVALTLPGNKVLRFLPS